MGVGAMVGVLTTGGVPVGTGVKVDKLNVGASSVGGERGVLVPWGCQIAGCQHQGKYQAQSLSSHPLLLSG